MRLFTNITKSKLTLTEMTRPLSPIYKYLCILTLMFCLKTVKAQVKYDGMLFRIDSLANVGLPKSALELVDTLDTLARKNNNTPLQIRAAIYRMTFQSYLEEDALVAIINRLKTDIDRAAYPVKPVLQSLLAQMYWNYYQQNRWRFNQRTKLEHPDADFTNWDIQTVISETSRLYELSLRDAVKEQNTPVAVLYGVLQGDSSTRYLRPTLYDLLVQRAFDFFLTDEAGITKPKLPFRLNDPRFFGDSRTFAGLEIKTTDTASTEYKGIKYLQQATAFHLMQKNEEALANLGMQRLKFLHSRYEADHTDSLYISALKQIAGSFSPKPISAEALVMEGQYYQGLDSLTIAYSFFKKAVNAWPKSLGGKNAAILIKQVEEKELSATVEDVNVPGKAILGLIGYKNLTGAKISIYRLSEEQLSDYNASYNKSYSTPEMLRANLDFLKKLNPVQIKTLVWPGVGDYRKHTLEFKMDALSPGNYVLLIEDTTRTSETYNYSLSDFKVTGLAYTSRVNPDDQLEIRVMERETGKPLSSVKLNLSGSIYHYNDTTKKGETNYTSENGSTDKNGLYLSNKFSSGENISVALIFKGDTLKDKTKYMYGAMDNTDDDDPEDKTILFTDRQIYRPGQTIYFKGLQLQTYKGKSKILSSKTLTVEFTDVNDKKVASIQLKTNEYGTFSGSFIIPQTMLNGNVKIQTVVGEITVKVEEYKRPSFQVTFLPVKDSYKLNDSVTIKGNVTEFSGYGLSQAKVAYHVTRTQTGSYYNNNFDEKYSRSYNYNPNITEIKTDTITTNDKGGYQIRFKAIPGENSYLNYTYVIKADVTDESGETHSGETAVTVGNNNIAIDIYLPEILFARDSINFPVSIHNLNGQEQKGEINIEVFALKNAGQVFKNRLWAKPDQFIISQVDFKKDFPEFAYQDEDLVTSWQRLNKVTVLNIKVDEGKPGSIMLAALRKQTSGIYKVNIHARDEKGDTISVTKFVNLVNKPLTPAKMEDWIVPVLNAVRPGDTAEFLAGINQKINILMEKYKSAKLISSKWITINKGQQNIKIPISDTDKDVAVQFMMVYQNRMYTSYQKVYVTNPDNNLSVKLLTFHNKLQPGQKEEWKLQIANKNNEKQSAEMVADLYDASLDDITAPENWRNALDEKEKYQPNYFAWVSYDFVNATSSRPVFYNRIDYNLFTRKYEQLNMFGYNYYGGYNYGYRNYLENLKKNLTKAAYDKQIQDVYVKNAALIKKGYDVTGKVIGAEDNLAIPGVVVSIKGMQISTYTNSSGYFKIRVPIGATLVFSLIGYETQQVVTHLGGELNIKLNEDDKALKEVTVVGYGVAKKKASMGSVASVSSVNIRGKSSFGYSAADTVEYKAAGVAAMENGAPGSSDKVIMREISIKAGRKFNRDLLIREPNLSAVHLRTNFAETAFFYPQLQTNEKGEILIDFTIPEALTRWKFRGFAHTKDLHTGYIEREVITQKQLSISANTPRFLREGDTITISARMANLTAGTLKGKVEMKLFNALNMQPVSILMDKADAEQPFEIAGGTNKAVAFRLIIPAGLDALTYRLTAEAGEFTDGEENTLPVLPNRMLVTESMPMMVRAGQTRAFTFDKLVHQNSSTLKNKTLTLEYTQNPAWYAVQALPYMMEFPYECSEQVFSRYYANSLATSIVNKMPTIKQVFDQWKAGNSSELLSNLEKNPDLKLTLLEETPWLNDAISESEQKKRIALLFDLNKMSDELKLNRDKLQKRQLPDGGFTWFGGDRADRYITQHIAEGMGELFHLGIADKQSALKPLADNAIRYLDDQLVVDENYRIKNKLEKYYSDLEIHAWYTRSFFLDIPLTKNLQKMLADYLTWAEDKWVSRNVYEQGLIALTMQRYKKPEITAQIERSLLETAQQSDDLGMYWAANRQGYFWYESPIETQSLLIDLFTEAGDNAKAVDEMKIWLLRNKQTNNWKTTKATAAACYALLIKGSDLLADTGKSTIKIDGKPLEQLKPDVKADAGTGYLKTTWADEQIKPALGKVEISNNSKNISWGALHWQYLENLDKITSSQTNIQLERKYFIQKQTDAGPVLTAVDPAHPPKTGDLLKVVVHLKADRDFEYVQLKDMRPAGTEPVDALSVYKYQDGLYYYQVTKDVATNFFISYLNKGNYVFEYQLRVAQPGNFSTGISSIQCIYAPEFNAHSQGTRINIKP